MSDVLSPADRERIAGFEIGLKELKEDVKELRGDLKEATKEFRQAIEEFKMALLRQTFTTKIDVARPMDKLTGVKLALVGLGSLVIGSVTVLGGVLGIISFFRGH